MWLIFSLFCAIIWMDRIGDRDMGSFLLSAFRTRYQQILAKAHNAAFTAPSKLLSFLTKEETNCKIYTTFVFHFFGLHRRESNAWPMCISIVCWHRMCLQLQCMRQLNPQWQPSRSGGSVAPDSKELLFLGGRGNQLTSWSIFFLNHCLRL